MKKQLLLTSLVLMFLSVSLNSCKSSSAMITSSEKFMPTNPESIEIFVSQKPNKEYVEIGRVSTDRYSFGIKRSSKKLNKSLKEKAAKIGGDAIINLTEDFGTMTGLVIKYK